MKLVIGIGNPGSKYEHTKHNIGFDILDYFARKHNLKFSMKTKFNAEVAEMNYQGNRALIVKPQTFVNLSGDAVIKLMDYYNIGIEDVIVIVDDMALDVGVMRIRELGGHGGHNGLRNIINHLKSKQFKRIRVGIGTPKGEKSMNQHVLSRFSKAEDEILKDYVFELAVKAVEQFIEGVFFTEVMTEFNTIINNGTNNEK